MKNIILFFFLFLSAVLDAHIYPDSLTREQTLHIIDSISHSPYRRIANEFSYEKNDLLLSQEMHIDKGVKPMEYRKLYHANGKLQSEGLELDKKIGTWMYYDTTGRLYKEYNFTMQTRRLSGMDKEPMQWAFDSVLKMSERFLIRHYGAAFYKSRIRIDPKINWYEDRYQPQERSLPDLPLSQAREYIVHSSMFINDSVDGPSLTFSYDKNLQLTSIYDLEFEDTAAFYPHLKISYTYALKLARSLGYEDVQLSEWDMKKKAYYWTSRKIISTEGTMMHGRTYEKLLSINGTTGKYSILDFEGGYDADGFISDYRKEWIDTTRVPEGWKAVVMDNITINLPVNWIVIHNYYHKTSADYYLLTDGADTLKYSEACGHFINPNEDFYVRDNVKEKSFLSHFKNGTVQGRGMKINIILSEDHHRYVEEYPPAKKQPPADSCRIEYSIEESGVAFNCGPVMYFFSSGKVTAKEAEVMLEILKTVRFTTY